MKRIVTAATVLLATLLVITVMPGSSVLDLNIDVGIKVLAFYVAYIVWAALTVLLVSVFLHFVELSRAPPSLKDQ